jgi:hypothetical protein
LRENFESNLAVEIQVEGTVDDSHAASADLREDFVMREGLANHKDPPCWCEDSGFLWGKSKEGRD